MSRNLFTQKLSDYEAEELQRPALRLRDCFRDRQFGVKSSAASKAFAMGSFGSEKSKGHSAGLYLLTQALFFPLLAAHSPNSEGPRRTDARLKRTRERERAPNQQTSEPNQAKSYSNHALSNPLP